MEITSYKKLSSNLYEVTIDKSERVKLYDEIILKYRLLIEKEIDKKKLEKLIKENAPLDCYYKALKYYSRRMRTRKELRVYLKKCEFDNDAINYAIKRMEEEGYLKESSYLEAFICDSLNLSLVGPKKIESDLSKLGISDKEIDVQLSKIDADIWLERINRVISKKYKVNKNGLALFKNKMYTELLRLGYESEMIRESIESFEFGESDNFRKEGEKIWNSLSKKYSDKELILRFKNKMYSKGFSAEETALFIEEKAF